MSGYWIVSGKVIGAADSLADYAAAWKPIAEAFGAEIIVGPQGHDTREGDPVERLFVVKFASYEQAVACYESREYQALLPMVHATLARSLHIVSGVD